MLAEEEAEVLLLLTCFGEVDVVALSLLLLLFLLAKIEDNILLSEWILPSAWFTKEEEEATDRLLASTDWNNWFQGTTWSTIRIAITTVMKA